MSSRDSNLVQEFKSLDLFAGCGGLSLGLSMSKSEKNSKIKTVVAIDNWKVATETFKKNLGLTPICANIDSKLIRKINQEFGPFDIVVGGPPCQGFSSAGKRALDDKRNKLVLEFLTAIKICKPKVFLMENVVGFKTFQGGKIYKESVAFAKSLGYKVRSAIVLSSLVGVPQRRKRFLLVGSLGPDIIFPAESKINEGMLFDEAEMPEFISQSIHDEVEVWSFDDATSDLPKLLPGESKEEYASEPANSLQRYFRKESNSPINHFAVGHRPDFIKLLSYIPQGRSALDEEIQKMIPSNLRPKSGFKNSYQRIISNQPSPTITRNFTTPSSANCIHPHEDRALSLREGARCQSFPDAFQFVGNTEEIRLQIGNAVPPLLGKALGESLLKVLDEM